MKHRFGTSGAARRQCPVEQWRWRSSLAESGLEGFTWRAYDDEQQPHAVGMRATGSVSHCARYEVVEWYGPQDVRRSHWKFQTEGGWTEV